MTPTTHDRARPAHTLPEAKETTRARFRDLRELISRYGNRHMPRSSSPTPIPAEPPKLVGNYGRLLPILQVIPWFLGLTFGVSFIWDFSGITFLPESVALPLDGLLRIISVSGLIGFFTNWLAITMLFHPREKRPIFGQGLIPAQRDRVIYRLARAISEELINEQIIKEKIESSGVIQRYREMALELTRSVLDDPEFRAELKSLLSDYLQEVLSAPDMREKMVAFTIEKLESYAGQGLSRAALRIYRFLNEEDFQRRVDEAIRELPQSVDPLLDNLDEMIDRVPEQLEARSDEIEMWATRVVLGFVEKLDVYSMIVENMHRYDEHQLERLLKTTSNEQLNYIKYLGGILGALGGFIIWQPEIALVGFVLTLATLLAIDVTLFRRRRKSTA